MVLDKRENSNSRTGGFELAYKQTAVPGPKCVDTNMKIEGKRIKKADLAKYTDLDKKNSVAETKKLKREREAQLKAAVAELKNKVKDDSKTMNPDNKAQDNDGSTGSNKTQAQEGDSSVTEASKNSTVESTKEQTANNNNQTQCNPSSPKIDQDQKKDNKSGNETKSS